jgi:hypothetical protein
MLITQGYFLTEKHEISFWGAVYSYKPQFNQTINISYNSTKQFLTIQIKSKPAQHKHLILK